MRTFRHLATPSSTRRFAGFLCFGHPQDIGWAAFSVSGLCDFQECQTRHDSELSMLSRGISQVAGVFDFTADHRSPTIEPIGRPTIGGSYRRALQEIVGDYGWRENAVQGVNLALEYLAESVTSKVSEHEQSHYVAAHL
jgi:hypothetical protein